MHAVVARRLTAVGSAALTTGAVLGALCLVVTLVAPLAGVRPLIFLSGSMSPTIPAGSLALAREVDAADIAVNDIVTVRSNGAFLTHRVLEVTHAPGRATLLLRGDGNEAPDATVYEIGSAPRTEIWVPHVGAVIAWFSHAPGVYVLAGWVALVLASIRRHRGGPGPLGGRRRPSPPKLQAVFERRVCRGRRLSRTGQVVVGSAFTGVLLAGSLLLAAPALAAWGDNAQVTGTTVSTVSPTAPVLRCGTQGLDRSITVHWDPVPGATNYRVFYGQGTDYEDVPASQTSVTADPSTAYKYGEFGYFKVRTIYGATTWLSPLSNEKSYASKNNGYCAPA